MRSEIQYVFKKMKFHKARYFLLILGIALSTAAFIAFQLSINKFQTVQLHDRFGELEFDEIYKMDETEDLCYEEINSEIQTQFPDFEVVNTNKRHIYHTYVNKSVEEIEWGALANPDYNLSDFTRLDVYGIDAVNVFSEMNRSKWLNLLEINGSVGDHGIYIDCLSANQWNLTVNDEITLGNLDISDSNTTASYPHLRVAGIFQIREYGEFKQYFGISDGAWHLSDRFWITSMDLVANLTSTFGLGGPKINEVYFRLRSNHTNLLGLDFDEIETYYDNLHQHLAIKSVILLGSPMASLLNDIGSDMRKISGYFLIMQFPILILSLFLIKINITQLQQENFRDYNMLKCRTASRAKIAKMILMELGLIAFMGSLLGDLLGILIFKLSSNPILNSMGYSVEDIRSNNIDSLIIGPGIFIMPIIFSLLFITISGYSYLKSNLSEDDINPADKHSVLQKNENSGKSKRGKVWALASLIVLSGLSYLDMLSLNGTISLSERVLNLIQIINTMLYPFFPLLPYIIIYLLADLVVPYFESGFRALISKIISKSKKQKIRFLFAKLPLTSFSGKNRFKVNFLIIMLSMGIGFSSIIDIINYNHTLSYTNQILMFSGGDSKLIFRADTQTNLSYSSEAVNSLETSVLNYSQLDIESLTRIYNQERIDFVDFQNAHLWGDVASRDMELISLNMSQYLTHQQLTRDHFGGQSANQIQQRFQLDTNAILLDRIIFNAFELNINDTLEVKVGYFEGTVRKAFIQPFSVAGSFANLPGIVPLGGNFRWSSMCIIGSDFKYNETITPRWDSLSLLIDYNIPEEKSGILAKLDTIKNSETQLVEALQEDTIPFEIEPSSAEEYYESYRNTVLPFNALLTLEKYYILGLVIFGIFILLLFTLESKKKKLALLQIRGFTSKDIRTVFFLESAIVTAIGIIISSVSLPLGFIANHLTGQYYNPGYIINPAWIAPLQLPLISILTGVSVYAGGCLLLYGLSALILIKKKNFRKIPEIIKTA